MRRLSGLAAMSIVAAAASLTLAGCVSLPSSGRGVNALPIADQAPGNQVGIVPTGPGPDWTPAEIVSGFLAACGAEAADGAANLDVAKAYLTASYLKHWRPGSAPDVIDTGSKVVGGSVAHFTNGQVSSGQTQVTVTSYHLENLVGDRLQVPGSSQKPPYTFTFALITVSGKWRIDSVSLNGKSSDAMLLENSDFLRDYQPRNLYFPANAAATTLVPSPVYIPDSAPQLGVAKLVEALLNPPPSSSWLYQAVTTAFPPGTRLISPVQVQGTLAVIDLGGAAANVDYARLQQMRAQLVWTLTYTPYGGTGIDSVLLRIGNKFKVVTQSDFPNWIPPSPVSTQLLYFQTLDRRGYVALKAFNPSSPSSTAKSSAARRHAGAQAVQSVSLPPGLGRGRFTAIAVSPTPPGSYFPATFAGCRGKTVYVAPLLLGSVLSSQSLPTACTSLSWDAQGDLFVGAGVNLFEVTATGLHVIPVAVVPSQIPDADTYASVKVAPDGVRVAMIARGSGGGGVYVAAIQRKGTLVYLGESNQLLTLGPDVANPVAVSWLDADHLLVLDQGPGGSELREVPLDGGQSVEVATLRGTDSITSNGPNIAIGASGLAGQGHLHVFVHEPDGFWKSVADGGTPVYPG